MAHMLDTCNAQKRLFWPREPPPPRVESTHAPHAFRMRRTRAIDMWLPPGKGFLLLFSTRIIRRTRHVVHVGRGRGATSAMIPRPTWPPSSAARGRLMWLTCPPSTPPLSVPSRLPWPGLVAQAAKSTGFFDAVAKKLVSSRRLAFHGPPLSSAAQARE